MKIGRIFSDLTFPPIYEDRKDLTFPPIYEERMDILRSNLPSNI